MLGILIILIFASVTLSRIKKNEISMQSTGAALKSGSTKTPTPKADRGPEPPVIISPGPDLIVESLIYTPNPAMQSAAPASVGFTFNIKNVGTRVATLPPGTKFTITCLAICHPTQQSNVVIGQVSITSTTYIQPNMRITYSGNTIATPTNNIRHMFGTYQTQLKADSTNLVAELYETNNLYNRPLVIKPAP